MLIADSREYRDGYFKNRESFKSLRVDNRFKRSRRLLLAYSVECGLKYLLLQKWEVKNYSEIASIINDTTHPHHEILISHDLQKLLKELNQAGSFRFPQRLKTGRSVPISSRNFHEYCRYMIRSSANTAAEEEMFEITLSEISEWINERIGQV